MENQSLLQNHARDHIYAMNLNETRYIGLFFLTEKSYNRICLKKASIFFQTKSNRKKPKNEVYCTQQVYGSISAYSFFIFPQSQLSYYC